MSDDPLADLERRVAALEAAERARSASEARLAAGLKALNDKSAAAEMSTSLDSAVRIMRACVSSKPIIERQPETDTQIMDRVSALLREHGIVARDLDEVRPGVWGGDAESIEKQRALGMIDVTLGGLGRVQGDPPFTVLRLQDENDQTLRFRMSVKDAESLCFDLVSFLAIYRERTRRQPDSSSGMPSTDGSPQDGHTPSPEASA